MKIAIIGNMNNNSNNLIRYLIGLGYDCELLFYNNEASHFVPGADNVDEISYPHRTLNWGSYPKLYTTSAQKIREDLAAYDFLIGARLAPAYAAKAGRSLDIFMPTGGDLHMLPMFSGFHPRDFAKFLFYSYWQKRGIRRSATLFWDMTNPETEHKIANVIKGMDRITHAIPAIYYPEFDGERLAHRKKVSKWLPKFEAVREGADVVLFHHVKHVWTPGQIRHFGKFHEKGNDQLIFGLRQYYDTNPKKRIKIIMFEFGGDHAATRALAEKLGVNEHITWFPQMERKEIMLGIGVADAVIGEVTRSWFSYGTIMEAMVMRRTVIHHRDDKHFAEKRLYPMIHICDAESFAAALTRIAEGEYDLQAMGEDGHRWLVEYGVGAPLQEIADRIHEKSGMIVAE